MRETGSERERGRAHGERARHFAQRTVWTSYVGYWLLRSYQFTVRVRGRFHGRFLSADYPLSMADSATDFSMNTRRIGSFRIVSAALSGSKPEDIRRVVVRIAEPQLARCKFPTNQITPIVSSRSPTR